MAASVNYPEGRLDEIVSIASEIPNFDNGFIFRIKEIPLSMCRGSWSMQITDSRLPRKAMSEKQCFTEHSQAFGGSSGQKTVCVVLKVNIAGQIQPSTPDNSSAY